MHLRGILSSVLIIVVAVAILVPASTPASAQAGFEYIPLEGEVTNVYGMLGYKMPGDLLVYTAHYASGKGVLVAAGEGYIAGISVTRDGTPAVVWRQSLIGTATTTTTGSYDSSWVAVGSDTGEVVLVNLDDPSIRADFYTASRVIVRSIALNPELELPVVTAIDEEGFLYIFALGENGWVEIGPTTHEAALKSYPTGGAGIALLTQELLFDGVGVKGLPTAIALPSVAVSSSAEIERSLLGLSMQVRASIFYETDAGGIVPAVTKTITLEDGTIIKRQLYYAVIPASGAKITMPPYEPAERDDQTVMMSLNPTDAENYVSFTFLAGPAKLVVIYTIEEYSGATGNLVTFRCYNAETPFTGAPGDVVNLGNVVARSVPATDFNDCVTKLGLNVFHNYTYFQPLILVNLESTPSQFSYLRDAWITILPMPGNNSNGISDASALAIFRVPEDSPLAEKGVARILIAGDSIDGGIIMIYLLDENWGLVDSIDSPIITYYLGSALTSIALGADATAIYAGTGNGHVYRFLWDGERYYAANALVVDSEGSITSIREIENGEFIIVSSSNGVVQLVRLEDWKPMWRGLPGFSGVATDISNLVLQGSTLNLLVGFSFSGVEGEASDRIYIFTPQGTDLNPIIVKAKLTVRKLTGEINEPQIPQSSYAALVDNEGNPLALAEFKDDSVLIYAPTGSYTLLVSIEGYGEAVAPIDVAAPLTSKSYEFKFVEARFSVYTPGEPPFPEAAIAYALLSGPKAGASLSFSVTQYYGETEYTPIASTFQVATGDDGSAYALLWSDTIYTVKASLDGYHEAEISFDSGVQTEAAIEIHPVLYKVNVKAIDAEVYRILTSEFPVKNAVLTVMLGERSAKIQLTEGITVLYLAKSTYTFIVEAPAYEALAREVTIAGNTDITLLVEPLRMTVPITVVLVDEVAGVANGPLPQTSVKVELVNPPLDYSFEGVTDEFGQLLLQGVRPGIYRITISDPVIGTVVVEGIEIFSDNEVSVRVTPIYVNVTINLVDSDLLVPAAGTFTLILSYDRIIGATTSLQINNSSATLTLPKGLYTITVVSREGYYYDYTLVGELISEDTEATIPLTPIKIPVTIAVVYNDEKTGLASGGVSGALVELRLVEPNLPYAKITGITGSDGTITLTLRTGVYEIIASSPLTETTNTTITVSAIREAQREVQAQSFIVAVKPLYATVNITVMDRDLLKPLPAALLRVTWEGATTTNSKIITVSGGQASFVVPLGRLSLTGILEGYYRPTTLQINLNVSGETTLALLMEPLVINARIIVFYEQQVVEINGNSVALPRAPAPNVKITLIPDDDLLEYLGVAQVTVATGDDGSALIPLRGGKYRVTLEGPHISASESTVLVNEESASITLTVKPILYNVNLTIIDPELRDDVGSPESIVFRLLSFNGVETNIELVTGPVVEAKLPAGKYKLGVTSSGYAESIQDVTIEGDTQEVIPLKPITREVFFTVTADTVLGVSQNVGGQLLLEAVSIPLKNPIIEVDVRQGQAIALLRLGEYNVYYRIPEADYVIPVTTLTVEAGEGQLQVGITVKPPKVNLALALVDSELEIPVNDATVTIVYTGPLGQFAQTVEGVNGSLQMELPPGVAVIDVEAPGYQAARQELVLKPDRVDAAIRINPLLYDVQLRLVDQDGVPVEDEVVVTLIHRELPYTKEVRGVGPTIQVSEIRPGSYQVIITPVESGILDETQAQVTIEPPGVATPDTLQINFRTFKVTLTLVDAVKGDTIPFPYTAILERVATGAPSPLEVTREITIQGSAQLSLPYGNYTVTLVPEGPDYYVVDEPFNITVDKDGEITLKLQPRIYVVTIIVTDDNNRPLANSFVRVTDAEGNEIQSGYTDANGYFIFRTSFGTYSVTVSHPGFHSTERIITVPQNTNVTISLEPGIRVLLLRYGPLVTGFASLAIIAVLIYRMRSTLSERLLKEEEYF